LSGCPRFDELLVTAWLVKFNNTSQSVLALEGRRPSATIAAHEKSLAFKGSQDDQIAGPNPAIFFIKKPLKGRPIS